MSTNVANIEIVKEYDNPLNCVFNRSEYDVRYEGREFHVSIGDFPVLEENPETGEQEEYIVQAVYITESENSDPIPTVIIQWAKEKVSGESE